MHQTAAADSRVGIHEYLTDVSDVVDIMMLAASTFAICSSGGCDLK
jgi:hypothetical protein